MFVTSCVRFVIVHVFLGLSVCVCVIVVVDVYVFGGCVCFVCVY